MAEFVHNQWPSTTTKKSPYDLIKGYTPQVEWTLKPHPVPTVTARLLKINKLQDDALYMIVNTQKVMKTGNPGNKKFQLYKEGDHIWVDGMNLKTLYPTAKLGPKKIWTLQGTETIVKCHLPIGNTVVMEDPQCFSHKPDNTI
jgi:hypothetical protein